MRIDRSRGVVLALFAAGVVLALFIYQPWRPAQFSVTDFCDFLPLLTGNRTFTERLAAFVHHYAVVGRFNVIQYVYFILEWSAFGWNAAAWHMSRFAEMCGMVVLVYQLLRRITGSQYGAAAGAGLFFVASCAAPAWIRLTLGESLAMWPLLGGALLATRYQSTPRWRMSGAAIAVLMALTILAKEVLVVFVPFVLLLAWTTVAPARFGRPVASRRNWWLAIITAALTAAVLLPIVFIATHVHGNAYSAGYGHGSPTVSRAIGLYMAMLYPTYATYAPNVDFALPANIIFLVVLAMGWALGSRDIGTRRSRRILGACTAAVPLVGVAVYLPWPFFTFYYGLPFQLASGALLAFSVAFIECDRPRLRWPAYAACIIIFANAAVFAAYDARRALAVRDINGALVDYLAGQSRSDTVAVAKQVVQDNLPWGGAGQILIRFAAAVYPDRQFQPGVDVSCDRARDAAAGRVPNRIVAISYSDECGALSHYTWSTRRTFSYVYWPSLSLRRDIITVEVESPPSPR